MALTPANIMPVRQTLKLDLKARIVWIPFRVLTNNVSVGREYYLASLSRLNSGVTVPRTHCQIVLQSDKVGYGADIVPHQQILLNRAKLKFFD
jgi:hypothetical protein